MSKGTSMPPKPLGRFVAAMRANACQLAAIKTLPEYLRHEVNKLPLRGHPKTLRRADVETLAYEIYQWERKLPNFVDVQMKRSRDNPIDYRPILEADVANLEQGKSSLSREKLYWVLRGVLLSDEEAKFVLDNDNFIHGIDALANRNGHIFEEAVNDGSIQQSLLLAGEYGLGIQHCMRFPLAEKWYRTAWLSAELGTGGRFEPSELYLRIDDVPVKPPLQMTKDANALVAEWETRRRGGFNAPTNNPTLFLRKLTSYLGTDDQERNNVTGLFSRSSYANNVIAKGEKGALERWSALQKLEFPPEPVDYLASGVGLAICVFCDSGEKVVLGQRSMRETFRKGEYDIAVVEGIRPTANVNSDNVIDLYGVLERAMDEELGTDRCQTEFGRPLKDFILDAAIFEIGVDLKYYQWNFMAYVVTSLSFHQIEQLWLRAKDRKENQRLTSIPATETDVRKFVVEHNIWSCGCACLLNSLELVKARLPLGNGGSRDT